MMTVAEREEVQARIDTAQALQVERFAAAAARLERADQKARQALRDAEAAYDAEVDQATDDYLNAVRADEALLAGACPRKGGPQCPCQNDC